MKTVLIILGKETSAFAKGNYNQGLFDAAVETLKDDYEALTTVVEDGYEPGEEIAKFKRADAVIFQYPVYWFMMPSSLKKYLDDVYAYGAFFGPSETSYGTGGLMKGKRFMLSTTWNAPEEAFGDENAFFGGRTAAEALLPMRNANTFCGLEELPHFFSHDIIRNPKFEADHTRFVKHLESVFARTPASV
jgi:modulator of drug activity B